jgi:hypothetical protein
VGVRRCDDGELLGGQIMGRNLVDAFFLFGELVQFILTPHPNLLVIHDANNCPAIGFSE